MGEGEDKKDSTCRTHGDKETRTTPETKDTGGDKGGLLRIILHTYYIMMTSACYYYIKTGNMHG